MAGEPHFTLPASKLPGVGTTIFTVMSELAARHGALNLSQGFPGFDPPEALRDLVAEHMRRGRNQYAPMAGVPELRAAIADLVAGQYGCKVDPADGITVTAGATEALFCAIQAFVAPGDEVIVFDPAYDSYDPAVRLAGGRCRHLPLVAPHFRPDWDRLADALTPATRMIVLNSPHNPTGAVLDAGDLATLADIVRDHDTLLLSDEVYEHIVFDGAPHASLLGHEELRARTLAVSSFGKSFHATGWKVGYVVAPAPLTAELRRVHQFVTFSVNTAAQHAIADFMTSCPAHIADLPAFYQDRRDRFCRLLEDSRFGFTPARGTYFQLLDYSAISDLDDVAMAHDLTARHGIAAIPLSPFCAEPPATRLLRFCFAKDDATLAAAADILKAV